MKTITTDKPIINTQYRIKHLALVRVLLAGLLLPLGFAPFHLPGLALLSLAYFYHELTQNKPQLAFILGLVYGIGFFGLGISWVAISVHDYGQLNYVIAGLITLLFVIYLAVFPACMAVSFRYLYKTSKPLLSALIFAILWIFSEYARANFMTGFPWLLVGISQIDTPLQYLAPIIGVYGLSLLACFSAALLATCTRFRGIKQRAYLIGFILIIISPSVLTNQSWTLISKTPISVGIIQSNLSMRDKWDETLFWDMLAHYKAATKKLYGTQLIVMPESAIPLPGSYVTEFLSTMDSEATAAGSAIILGMLHPANTDETAFLNAVITLGAAQGQYAKQHLVPFGEYIPAPFKMITNWLGLPDPNIIPGASEQAGIMVHNHPVANLICYEIAYQHLLRKQLPQAEWIISNSDNGWFGHSLASYQHFQMAQMLSLQTGRYQVVSNNDGLSSVINTQGKIVKGLAPFSAGILEATLYPASGTTPWVALGDNLLLIICGLLFIFIIIVYKNPTKN